MSCFGDGKCMTLCNTTYCYKPHEISKYKFCKTECKNECELNVKTGYIVSMHFLHIKIILNL